MFYNMITLLDNTDSQLRHSIANLIAVVLGLPPKSNHLWYHMFEPKELQNTYMTGFMVKLITCTNSFYVLFCSMSGKCPFHISMTVE